MPFLRRSTHADAELIRALCNAHVFSLLVVPMWAVKRLCVLFSRLWLFCVVPFFGHGGGTRPPCQRPDRPRKNRQPSKCAYADTTCCGALIRVQLGDQCYE